MTIGLNIKGYNVIIDEEDYELISKHSWRIEPKKKYVRTSIHRKRPLSGKNVYMHRLIMGLHNSSKPHIDHKNRNPLDNRKCNLRIATVSQNNINSRKGVNNPSGYRGVYYIIRNPVRNPSKAIIAKIAVNKTVINLGFFNSEIEAARAYNEAAIQYHGEFAMLNLL